MQLLKDYGSTLLSWLVNAGDLGNACRLHSEVERDNPIYPWSGAAYRGLVRALANANREAEARAMYDAGELCLFRQIIYIGI